MFSNYIEHILNAEGGYVNDPLDNGGETNFGISKRAYPNLDIKNLTIEQAKDIYHRDYWLKAKCDRLPNELQAIHFDSAVNHGVSRAVKLLQKAIGTVKVDGIIGFQTIMNSPKATLGKYTSERALFYAKIVARNPRQLKYLKGWMIRLNKVTRL